MSVLSLELRTDLVQEHALPQLPGFPLIVVLGKTSTRAHAAPIMLTQYVCMETSWPAGELSPVQMGCYQGISGGRGLSEGTNVTRSVSNG